MKFFIDNEFKCHVSNSDGAYREFEDVFFDNKCPELIECYRYVPEGEQYVRSDGTVFEGKMVTPWKYSAEIYATQQEYEQALLKDMQQALHTLGVNVDG